MEKILQSISTKLNLPESTVRSGVGILLNFLKQKAPGTPFANFLSAIPGAEAFLTSAPKPKVDAGSGLLGGLLGKAGGLLGGDAVGVAGALSALQQAGIPMDKAAPLAGEFIQQAETVAGPEVVNALLAEVPVLRTFLSPGKGL